MELLVGNSATAEVNELKIFLKVRHSSKQVNILILKTILFISQNMFLSIHTSSSVAKIIIKTVN